MEVSARRAGATDLDDIARLVVAARAGVGDQRGGPAWLATAAPVPPASPADLTGPAAWFVGCIDEVPVGVVLASAGSWPDGTTVVEIGLLYVEPAAREVGVGEELVEAVLGLGREVGAAAVESTALPGDRELKNLFERFGLVARAITVHKRLDPG